MGTSTSSSAEDVSSDIAAMVDGVMAMTVKRDKIAPVNGDVVTTASVDMATTVDGVMSTPVNGVMAPTPRHRPSPGEHRYLRGD